MYEYQRALAEFFARLANIPHLDGVPEEERNRLLDDYLELCRVVGHAYVQVESVTPRVKQQQYDALTKRPKRAIQTDRAWIYQGLKVVHDAARKVIVPVLDGEEVPEPRVNPPQRHIRLSPEGTLTQVSSGAGGPDVLTFELLLLLHTAGPFPFRRCPVCQTIFVPVRHQKYCTHACTVKGVEMARKGGKRDYMRAYMAKRRQNTGKAAEDAA